MKGHSLHMRSTLVGTMSLLPITLPSVPAFPSKYHGSVTCTMPTSAATNCIFHWQGGVGQPLSPHGESTESQVQCSMLSPAFLPCSVVFPSDK
mmetsp:Transcript_91811/g.153907  ORF Transcript_91811/g.153907 Transcript_91811/m.153907 type:complete len:93 (-) Transcript_91811:1878-2156(-)